MTPVRAAMLAGFAVLLAGLLLLTKPSASLSGSSDEHFSDDNTCVSDCDPLYQICCLEDEE